jgi:AraC-like DNA-binding protein
MPGAEHMIEFHGVSRGSCRASIHGEPPVRLHAGDVILFPQGHPHVMSSSPDIRANRVDDGLYFAPRPPQLPYALCIGEHGVTTALLDGGGSDRTTIVCGFLACDAKPWNPLLTALPRVLHMEGIASGEDSWIAHFLRRYVESLPADQTGWLAGIRDPLVGRALAVLHARPGEAWSLEQLGAEACLSRSALHERFVHFIGQPPMQYLTQWRMAARSARAGQGARRDGGLKPRRAPQGLSRAVHSPAAAASAGRSPASSRTRAGRPRRSPTPRGRRSC